MLETWGSSILLFHHLWDVVLIYIMDHKVCIFQPARNHFCPLSLVVVPLGEGKKWGKLQVGKKTIGLNQKDWGSMFKKGRDVLDNKTAGN